MVYGRTESIRCESDYLLNKRLRFGRRMEAGGAGEKNGELEQDTQKGVSVVADLEWLDL